MAKRQFQALLILNALTSVTGVSSAKTLSAQIASAQEKKSSDNPSTSPTASASDPVLVGAGDIASCDALAGAEATAKLIDKIPGTVFAAGDLAYPDGSAKDFANCYGPTWGRFKDQTRPAPGNHQYHSSCDI